MESLLFIWAREGQLARQRGSLSIDSLKIGAARPMARHTSEPTIEEDTAHGRRRKHYVTVIAVSGIAVLVAHVA